MKQVNVIVAFDKVFNEFCFYSGRFSRNTGAIIGKAKQFDSLYDAEQCKRELEVAPNAKRFVYAVSCMYV